MAKIPATLIVAVIVAASPARLFADPPSDPPFEQLETKIDDLAEKVDDLAETTDDLGQKVDDLLTQLGLLQSAIGLIEAKLDVEEGPSCPAVPALVAAITKQIEQLEPPAAGGCSVLVEIVSLTNQPFKPLSTQVLTPAGVEVLSGPTTSCSPTINDKFRCNHQMLFQYDGGTSASGGYQLQLQYACDPESPDCDTCGSPATIDFSLATTVCIEVEVPGP